MAARPIQALDIAAILYIKKQTEDKDRDRSWLAKRSGIPYQTLRKWWDSESAALSLGDLDQILTALGVDAGEAMKEIRRIAATIQQ